MPTLGIQAAAWVALGCEVLLLGGSAALVRRAFGWLPSARLRRPRGAGRRRHGGRRVAAALVGLWLSVPVGAAAYLAALTALGLPRLLPLAELRRGRSADSHTVDRK